MEHANKCVCEICKCGSHRCPKDSHVPFYSSTQHKDTYVPHTLPEKHHRPQQKPTTSSYDPSLLHTSYKDDYQAHPLSQPPLEPSSGHKPVPTRGGAPFYGSTSYKDHFDEKPLQPQHRRAVPLVSESAPF
jgi:hypothetical protein